MCVCIYTPWSWLNSIFCKRRTVEKGFLKAAASSHEINVFNFPLCHFFTGNIEERKGNKKVKMGGREIKGEKSGKRKKQSPVFR